MKTGISSIEHELKVRPSAVVQIKLLSSLRSQRMGDLTNTLKGILGVGDFVVTAENVINVSDDYYDTDSLDICRSHSVFRVRREFGATTIVLKTLMSQSPGEFKRNEIEIPVSEIHLQDMVSTGFHDIVKENFPDSRGKPLRLKLEVTNKRRNFLMDRGAEKYRLSVDAFVYTNPATGGTSGLLHELEIEAKSEAASAKLHQMKGGMLSALRNFSLSTESKYERGIRIFHLDGPGWKQTLAKWNTGLGLNWMSLLISVVSLVFGALGIWLVYSPPTVLK